MAYATGIANSSLDLKNALIAFCTTNGWTESAGVLSKGDNHFLPAVTGNHLKVDMGDAAGFVAPGITGANNYPYISVNNVWPVTYRLFAISEDGADTVVLAMLEANGTEYKYMMFGNLQNKLGVWNGGQWMHATYASQSNGSTSRQSNAGINIDISGGPEGGSNTEEYIQAHGPLFAFTEGWPNFGSNYTAGNSFIKCDIDGGTYKRNQLGVISSAPSRNGCVDAFRFAKLLLYRGRNAWNGQSCLVPAHVILGRASTTFSRLGTIGHIRFMRMDNYEPGDIITLGLDRWMVLPMYKRDATTVYGAKGSFNNTAAVGHSGQLAYAIKYDGP